MQSKTIVKISPSINSTEVKRADLIISLSSGLVGQVITVNENHFGVIVFGELHLFADDWRKWDVKPFNGTITISNQ